VQHLRTKAFCGTSENAAPDTQNPAKPGFYLIEISAVPLKVE
jgi:hypothetical protein